MTQAFIALGTNIEPRENHFIKALEMLTDHGDIRIKQISSIYETDPVGYEDQADFLNMVIEIETELTAEKLLHYCQLVEERLGRVRTIRNGPRTIDLDILLYSQNTIKMADLEIPHPRMSERAFVLVPLNNIASEVLVPGTDRTVQQLLRGLSDEEKSSVREWPVENRA